MDSIIESMEAERLSLKARQSELRFFMDERAVAIKKSITERIQFLNMLLANRCDKYLTENDDEYQ